MRDDAGRVEELALRIVVEAPRVARALGEDLEGVARRVITPDAGVDLLALGVRRAGLADDRMSEHAVVAVEPAVGAPDETVERLVRVVEAPAVEQHDRLARLVVGVLRDEEEFRGRADPHAAMADFDARDQIEAFLEDRDLGVGAVLLHVLQDEDAVGALPVRTFLRIGHAFHDPETAAFVEAHRDRLDDLGLGRDERDLEARRKRHRLHRLDRSLARLIRPWRDPLGRSGRQRRGGETGGCEEERDETHGGGEGRIRSGPDIRKPKSSERSSASRTRRRPFQIGNLPVRGMSYQTAMKHPLALLALLAAFGQAAVAQEVKLVEQKDKRQVDVLVDGQPFTSYVYWSDQKKPLLSPLRTAQGNIFTRGFPLEKIAGERTDHPHHISSWFNYGDVNGTDFWNSPPEGYTHKGKMPYGAVKHKSIKTINGGNGAATLEVSSDWIMADGSKVLQQDETLVFRAAKDLRIIDRIITLTAQEKDAVFHDSKEGAIAIRVTRALEEPSTKPEIFTDAAGIPTTVAKLDNTGVNGVYLSSEGAVGEKDAWSTRAKWMTLSGNVRGEDVCVGIFDHPKNVTYPTYWHCRGYGLFAANPFGAKEFPKGNPSKKALNFTLKAGQSETFRFRILIHSGKLDAAQTEAQYQQFLKDVK